MPLAFLGATVENVRCTFLWQQGGVASLPVAPLPPVPSVLPPTNHLYCTVACPVRARLLPISPIPASRTLVTCIPRPSCRLRCHTTWPPSGAARATTPLRYASTLVRAHTRPLDRQTVLPWTHCWTRPGAITPVAQLSASAPFLRPPPSPPARPARHRRHPGPSRRSWTLPRARSTGHLMPRATARDRKSVV